MRQRLTIIVTFDIAFSWIRHVTLGKISDKDMQHRHFLKSTWDIEGPQQAPKHLHVCTVIIITDKGCIAVHGHQPGTRKILTLQFMGQL